MKNIRKVLFLIILVNSITAFVPKKSKILIIGDSISIGYTPVVQENLRDIADVYHNPGNARHTRIGLKNIEQWIGNTDWDIIQFNWGLHDLCYRHPESKIYGQRDKLNGSITFSLEEYEHNLDALVKLIQQTSAAKLIFVTTSYVPENEAGRYAEDPIKYNTVARKVMLKYGVAVNDIYKKSKKIHRRYGKGNEDVHYAEEGYEKLGWHITKYLKKNIKE